MYESTRQHETSRHNSRLEAAYEAALAVARETTPEAVLQRIVDLAREVVPARYGALGVADEHGRITHFITSGISPELRAKLGPIPEGHGLIGELIAKQTPLLVPDIAADPRSIGFPPGHPPMRTLLGVPILLGERVLGNIYLTEHLNGEPFDDEDLAALQVLATHAAPAIDRAHAYRRIEEQRDQFRIILDSLPSGVFIVNKPDARPELINRTAIEMIFNGPAPQGMMPQYGRDVRFLDIDGTPFTKEQRLSTRALRGEVFRNQQIIMEGSSGRRVPMLVQANPLPNADGEIDRAVLVMQDITRLREAEQLKDDFLSLVSHEVRTPLTAIHGGAHLLMNQGDALDDQTRFELLCDIVDESDRLDRMLTNMLLLTDVMAGRLKAKTEPILVVPLVRKAATEVSAHSGRHTFSLDVAAGVPPAEGDPSLLSQVLGNLYQNAVKYAPGGGKIATTIRSDASSVVIELADQGIGLAADEVPRVFDRFYRTGADPSVRGTGLGLYLSRHLINAQGGQITVSSPGRGQGSVFTITLPITFGWEAICHEVEDMAPVSATTR
jgi:signal transduction histidine kinase